MKLIKLPVIYLKDMILLKEKKTKEKEDYYIIYLKILKMQLFGIDIYHHNLEKLIKEI